jgi:hypothetical protein
MRGQVDDGGAAATTQSRSDRQIRSATKSNDQHQHRSISSLGVLSDDVSSSSATHSHGHVRLQRNRRRQSAALEPTAVTTLKDSFQSPNQLSPSTRFVAQRQQPSPFTGNEVQSSSPSLNVTTPAASKALLREAPSSNTNRSKTSSTSKLAQPAHTTSHMGGKSSSADQVRRRGSDSKKQRRAPTTSATNNVATFTSPPKRTATNARTSTAVTQNQGGHDRRARHDHHRRPLEPAVPSTSPSRLRTAATATTTHTTTTTPVAVSRSHEHSLHVQATRRSIDGTYMDAYIAQRANVYAIMSTCEGIGYVQPQ